MALTRGTRLGPYEIREPLGAGGMGEVYRARDERLGRDVAIKVLPEHVAGDPDALARFEREARAVAGLSHPNILSIHDFGVQDGTAYSVTELLEGQTLRQRLAAAPLPVRKVLDYAAQIARGLAAAHDKGVIHRDLKPENIFITEDGRAKILDFGLAKIAVPSGGDLTASPTVEAATRPGTVMGTLGYMSPEQVRGQEADARSDLFSFGAILHEMLTGERAFWRDTPADTMSAILKEEPPSVSTASGEVSPGLQRIVEHCLEKSPGERFQSARDLAFHLEAVGTGSSAAAIEAVPSPEPRRRRGRPAAAVFAVGLVLGLVAGALAARTFWLPAPHPPPTLRYLTFSGRDAEPSASPDGRLIVYTNQHGGRSQIWVKQFPGGNELALTEGPGDLQPRISPDGSQVLFTRVDESGMSLMRIPVLGGDPRRIVADAYDGDWSPDGTRVAFLRDRAGEEGLAVTLGTVDATGRESRDLTTVNRAALAAPRWSPDGRTIAVLRTGTENAPNSLLLVDVETGATRTLEPPPPAGRMTPVAWNEGGNDVVYSIAGSFISSTSNYLSGRVILQDVSSGGSDLLMWLPNAAATLDILGPGSLVIGVDTTPQNLVEVALDDRTTPGKVHRLTRGNSADRQPVFSSDGQWMLFSSNRGGNLDLWMMSMETGAIRRVTEDEADDWDPAFTPDGKGILWSSNRSGAFEIWTCATDGTAARQVTQDGLDAENPTATPDGRWVVYNSANPDGPGIWKIHPDGTGAERIVPGSWSVPDVSPDGRHVAFRTGGAQRSLLVARLEDGAIVGGPWDLPGQITNGRARWMPDGRRLLFTGSDPSGAMGIYIQDFEPGRDTRATRKPLIGFDEDLIPESFAVSPDGTHLVYSGSDTQQTLMLAEGLQGIAPARHR